MNSLQPTAAPARLQAFVTKDQQNPIMGVMPANTYVVVVHCHCTEAFTSSGTDEITVGWDSDPDALCTAIDVSTTGVKTITMGVNQGFNATAQKVEAYYSNGGTESSAGEAFIWIESIRTPSQP